MNKFKNKYRITTARLQGYDYGKNGAYFITICTQNRECFFGDVRNNQMQLNALGQCAEKYWMEMPSYFPIIGLGEFVVMPNHIHGILIINKNGGDGLDGDERRDAINRVSTLNPESKKTGGFAGEKNPMFYENISRIVRWYKGRCSFEIRKIHDGFGWQPRFHDHIIRGEQEYHHIEDYILNNPSKWDMDKFYL